MRADFVYYGERYSMGMPVSSPSLLQTLKGRQAPVYECLPPLVAVIYMECLTSEAVMPVAECLAPQRTAEWLWHQLSLHSVYPCCQHCEVCVPVDGYLVGGIALHNILVRLVGYVGAVCEVLGTVLLPYVRAAGKQSG